MADLELAIFFKSGNIVLNLQENGLYALSDWNAAVFPVLYMGEVKWMDQVILKHDTFLRSLSTYPEL